MLQQGTGTSLPTGLAACCAKRPGGGPLLQRSERRRGAALVELALVLPLLVTIVLACIDFGRFGAAYIALTNAVRAGAGYGSNQKVSAATLGTWQSRIQTAVRNEFAAQSGVNVNRLTVPAPQRIQEGSLYRVQVTATYNFQMIVPWPMLPNQVTISRRVEMRMIF